LQQVTCIRDYPERNRIVRPDYFFTRVDMHQSIRRQIELESTRAIVTELAPDHQDEIRGFQ
jgi:hypothetical protein